MKELTITYRVKAIQAPNPHNGNRMETAIPLKRKLGRGDVSEGWHSHPYSNSALMPGLLQRYYIQQIWRPYAQTGRAYIFLSKMPDCVSVDTSKFLAVVTFKLTY